MANIKKGVPKQKVAKGIFTMLADHEKTRKFRERKPRLPQAPVPIKKSTAEPRAFYRRPRLRHIFYEEYHHIKTRNIGALGRKTPSALPQKSPDFSLESVICKFKQLFYCYTENLCNIHCQL